MTLPYSSYTNRATQRRTILLVEDEPFVRQATASILSHAGFDVLPAVDANEALSLYRNSSATIDLVMSDLVLPDRSGRQLIQDLRQSSPGMLALLTSGYLETEGDSDSPTEQTYYLAKPYSTGTLIGKIEQILCECEPRATQAG